MVVTGGLPGTKKTSSADQTGQAVLGAESTPASSPAPTATPESTLSTAPATPAPAANSAAADEQRKADLASYVAAYKATAKNGYYAVTPPAVSVTATDPATGQAYVVAKTDAAAVGQIKYWPGGSCTGPAKTPGATGTKYLALQTVLSDASVYCLDVK
jgi:hypothetical protein